MTVLGSGGRLQFQRRQQAPITLAASHLNTSSNSLSLGLTHLNSGDAIEISAAAGGDPLSCFVHRDAMDRLTLHDSRERALDGAAEGRLAVTVLSLLGCTLKPLAEQAEARVEAFVGEWDLQTDRAAMDLSEASLRFGDSIQAMAMGQGTADFQLVPARLEPSTLAWFLQALHQGCEAEAAFSIAGRQKPNPAGPRLHYVTTIKVVHPAINTRQFPELISGSFRFIATRPVELKSQLFEAAQ